MKGSTYLIPNDLSRKRKQSVYQIIWFSFLRIRLQKRPRITGNTIKSNSSEEVVGAASFDLFNFHPLENGSQVNSTDDEKKKESLF